MLTRILNWQYVFKTGTELIWAVLVAAVVTAAPIIAGADLAVVLADPKAWLVALVAACARPVAVAAMAVLRGAVATFMGE